jgi:hypothetical protein
VAYAWTAAQGWCPRGLLNLNMERNAEPAAAHPVEGHERSLPVATFSWRATRPRAIAAFFDHRGRPCDRCGVPCDQRGPPCVPLRMRVDLEAAFSDEPVAPIHVGHRDDCELEGSSPQSSDLRPGRVGLV